MNILLWVLQVLAALLYEASGVMKAFMFHKISQDVSSFGAMPREAWMALGVLEPTADHQDLPSGGIARLETGCGPGHRPRLPATGRRWRR